MGYEEVFGNYRVWIPEDARIEVSRDVEFCEIPVPTTMVELNQKETVDAQKMHEQEVSQENEDCVEQTVEEDPLSMEEGTGYQLRNRSAWRKGRDIS